MIPLAEPSTLPQQQQYGYSQQPFPVGLQQSDPSSSLPSGPADFLSHQSPVQLVTQALQRADLAVKLDHDSRYTEALQAYSDTIFLFESALEKADEATWNSEVENRNVGLQRRQSMLPDGWYLSLEDRRRLVELRNGYVKRVDVLLPLQPPLGKLLYNSRPSSILPPTAASFRRSSSIKPTAPSQSLFESILTPEPFLSEPPDPPPPNPLQRPFYYMRLLAQSISTGGFITPSLYIPRQLWLQPASKFVALEAKQSAVDQLLNVILRAKAVDATDTRILLRELDAIVAALDNVRETLGKKLRFILKEQQQQTDRDDSSSAFSLSASNINGSRSPLESSSSSLSNFGMPSAEVTLNSLNGSSTYSLPNPGSRSNTSRLASFTSKLSKSLSTLQKSTKPLNLYQKTTPRNSSTSNNPYLTSLQALFSSAQLFSQLLSYYETLPPAHGVVMVMMRLKQISAFFGGVVVSWCLKDLDGLGMRWGKKGRRELIGER
ncbi:hypothetical protein BC832DRAFT_333800 [Gaertneriomyces semiglobifer]|nr:hypothetical protein BC832DRAFT_333800 [Gaertneriomyces semiglobifer]